MNHHLHYARLIERARGRVTVGYTEKHHVLPRCLGGTNAADNLVRLTGREHYVAHLLLVKLHPERPALSVVVIRMAKQCTGSRPYAWMREIHARAQAARYVGRKLPDSHRQAISAAHKGRVVSADTRAAIAATLTGRKRSAAEIAAVSAGLTGLKHTAEARAAKSARSLGKKRGPMSEQGRANLLIAGALRSQRNAAAKRGESHVA